MPNTTTNGHDSTDPEALNDRFKELSDRCQGTQSRESYLRFWEELFKLDEWYFLTDAPDSFEAMAEGSGRAAVLGIRDQRNNELYISVYTSDRRAAHSGGQSSLKKAGDPVSVVSMRTKQAIEFLAQHGPETTGIVVNDHDGEFALNIGLDELVCNYEFGTGSVSELVWPRFSAGVTKANTAGAWRRLYERTVSLDSWIVPVNEAEPDKPIFHAEDESSAMMVLFTHERYAHRAAELGQIPVGREGESVSLRLIRATPEEVMKQLTHFHTVSKGVANLALFNVGSQPFGLAYAGLTEIMGPSESA